MSVRLWVTPRYHRPGNALQEVCSSNGRPLRLPLLTVTEGKWTCLCIFFKARQTLYVFLAVSWQCVWGSNWYLVCIPLGAFAWVQVNVQTHQICQSQSSYLCSNAKQLLCIAALQKWSLLGLWVPLGHFLSGGAVCSSFASFFCVGYFFVFAQYLVD